MKRPGSFALVAVGLALGACSDGRGDLPAAPSVPVEESRAPVVYVAVGSGETNGGELDNDDRVRAVWPQVLFRTALPRRTVFYNAASESSTVEDALDEQLADALEVEPTLATVWLGPEDASVGTPIDDYERDLGELIEALRGDGGTRVMVAVGGPSDGLDGGDLAPYDAVTERVAASNGAETVDLSGIADLDIGGNEAVAAAFAERIGDVR